MSKLTFHGLNYKITEVEGDVVYSAWSEELQNWTFKELKEYVAKNTSIPLDKLDVYLSFEDNGDFYMYVVKPDEDRHGRGWDTLMDDIDNFFDVKFEYEMQL